MRKQLTTLVAVLTVLSVVAGAVAAGPRGLPSRYAPRSMDGPIQVVDVPGRTSTVAAWAYRSGSQYDIAVTSGTVDGEWSDPIFLGKDDGSDQIEPVVAADANGTVYLAFTDRAQGRVMLSYRLAGRADWSQPIGITPQGAGAQSPGLRVVGDRVVVGFDIDGRVQIVDLPLMIGAIGTRTINDSPDPIGYEDDDPPEDDEEGYLSPDYAPKRGKVPTR